MKSCILRICRCPSHCIDVLRVCSGLSPSCHQKAFCWMFLYVVIVSLHQSSPRWGTSLFLFSCYLTAILGRSLPMFSIWTNGNFVFEKLERLFCYLWEPWFWFLTHRKGELVRLARVLIVEKPHTELTCQKLACNQTGERHRCEHGTSWLKNTLGCKWYKWCPFDVTGQCFVNQKDLARSAGGCEPSWSLTSNQVSGPAESIKNQIARFTAKIMARSNPFLDVHLEF